MSHNIAIPGAAFAGSGTGLSEVIEAGGYVQDGDDDSYVETILNITGHGGGGGNILSATPEYFWEIEPASGAPDYGDTSNHRLQVRARITIPWWEIELNPGDALEYGFHIARMSSPLALTSATFLRFGNDTVPHGPVWVTANATLDEPAYEALRTGSWPGYGEIGVGTGWSATPGESPIQTAPPFGNVIQLHEMTWTLQPAGVAPPCHLYPRDDDQGVGSGAIWPPPSSGRPGGYY